MKAQGSGGGVRRFRSAQTSPLHPERQTAAPSKRMDIPTAVAPLAACAHQGARKDRRSTP
eukprot:6281193-Pyramimonas_sp.AAC.1